MKPIVTGTPATSADAAMRLAVPMISRTLATWRSARYDEHFARRIDAEVLEEAREQPLAQRAIRRLHLHDEPALEARAQALLETGELARRAVARNDELLALGVERVEDVEQLFLRALLAGDELHVVEQQRVGLAIARAPTIDGALLQRRDQLVDEQLRGNARHATAMSPPPSRRRVRCRWR